MPLPDHLEFVPDVPPEMGGTLRPKQGTNRCPECGIDLSEQDPKLHVSAHYPARWDPNNPPSPEARKRREQLENMTISSKKTEEPT